MKSSEVYLKYARRVFAKRDSATAYNMRFPEYEDWWCGLMGDARNTLASYDYELIVLALCLMSEIVADKKEK